MDSVRKILTPSAVWGDFNGSLPLKEGKVSEMTYDKITYTEVYFSGRETESGRVRIYGLYARPQTLPGGKQTGGVLILPDFCDTVDLETVNYFAKQGYSVLMLDYRGETGETVNHTIYPTEIEYANYYKAGDVFKVERTAKETCWYEWVAVAKYGIAYLKSRPEIDKVGVVGIKQGGNVGWQLLFNEDRVSCFVTLFGIGWQAYKGLSKYEGTDIEMDDERYRWLGGVEAHVYAQYANCPVLYVAGTNSSQFDCDRGVDTLARVTRDRDIKCSFNYAPRLRDVVDKKCTDDISIFLKKYLSRDGVNTDKYTFPESPQLSLALGEDGRTVFAEVVPAEIEKLKGLSVYISEDTSEPSKRNWNAMQLIKRPDADKRYFKITLGGSCDFVNAFAVADYKNGVSVSSKILFKKIEPSPASPSKMLFSSKDGTDSFTIYNERTNSVGKVLFTENSDVELVSCANSIIGVTSRYGLLTYKIGEKRFDVNARSIVKFDVYCEEYTNLCVSLMVDDGQGDFVPYNAYVRLSGGKSWQNVQISFSEFKNEGRMGIKNNQSVIALKIDAESRFAINNLLLI